MTLLDLPQDRDHTPYAYPAVFGAPWLEEGHVDIKAPLIHWSYKLWWLFILKLGILKRISLPAALRILPLIGLMLSALCLSIAGHSASACILVFLSMSPTLWPHMANTEWLTVTLICLAMALPSPINWLILGLIPWSNQKNVILVPFLIWAMQVPLCVDSLLMLLPSMVILFYLSATDRLLKAYHWIVFIPSEFGKHRTFKRNSLALSRLWIPCLALMAPFIATCGVSRWTGLMFVVMAVMVWSKQIVPHHFLLMALPLALAAHPAPLMWVAVALVWIPRDGICLWKPSLTYRFTFSIGSACYGDMLADGAKIEKWLREHTPADEIIWVNGMENQIYLNCMRKAWRIDVPELPGTPQRVLEGYPKGQPRYIVHCKASAKQFDYAGYEPLTVSTSGEFTLLQRLA